MYVSSSCYRYHEANSLLQENELWDKESNHSVGSWAPPSKLKNDGYAESRTASLYGRETYYERPQSRAFSPSPSQNVMYPPPGYASGRNTPVGAQSYSPLRPMSEVAHLQQPVPSRPPTNYFDIPISNSNSGGISAGLGDFMNTNTGSSGPSDAELEQAVQNVLRGADLNTITKKAVRQRLEETFGVDLTPRKATINSAIDRIILDQTTQ